MIKNYLRYFGGKKKLREEYIDMLPDTSKVKKVISPFFGGGSFEYHLLNYLPKSVKVQGYDIDPLLVNYHRCFIKNPAKLYAKTKKYIKEPMTKKQFEKMGDRMLNDSSLSDCGKAAMLLALSLNGYNGKIFTYAKKPKIGKLTGMKDTLSLSRRLNINLKSGFSALENKKLSNSKDIFWFCDPPYWLDQNYYGFKNKQHSFDHERLARALSKIKGKFLLCYNDCRDVLETYDSKKFFIYEVPVTHTKVDRRTGKVTNTKYYELVITNYDVDKYN